MSKENKEKHWLLDREIPKWSTKIGNTKVEFQLGGRVPDGWKIRDFLKFVGLVWALLMIVMLVCEISGML